MGTIQPELFYIPWGRRKRGDGNIRIRVVNAETLLSEKIVGLEILMFNSSNNRYCYDYDLDAIGDRHCFTPTKPPQINNYNDLQEILDLPDDDETKMSYEYGLNMLSFDHDEYVPYPWDYRQNLLKREDFVMADKVWKNPESAPDVFVWEKNKNTPEIEGAEFEYLKDTSCKMTFESREVVVIKNMPKGVWNFIAYIDGDNPDTWTLDKKTNQRTYAPDKDYWRDNYIDMDFYNKWVAPYDNTNPKQYKNKNDYYYINEIESYQPYLDGIIYNSTRSMKNRPYDAVKDGVNPEHMPYYVPDVDHSDINDTHGNIAQGWNAPSEGNAINVSSSGKVSFYAEQKEIHWFDPRYKDRLDKNQITPYFNYFYGMNHVLPDNTIYYLVSAPSFRGTAIVKQQVEEGGVCADPADFQLFVTDWGYENPIPGDPSSTHGTGYKRYYHKYEGGCQFEITYDDGTKAYAGANTRNTTPITYGCYANLPLRKGRNIIRSISAPYYGGHIDKETRPNLNTAVVSDNQVQPRYLNDGHIETVTITESDLEAMKQGTYTPPVFNFCYAAPDRLTIRIVRKELPPGVKVVTWYEEPPTPENPNPSHGQTYDYCNALEFYCGEQYFGYLQAGIAPYGCALASTYGMNIIVRSPYDSDVECCFYYEGFDLDEDSPYNKKNLQELEPGEVGGLTASLYDKRILGGGYISEEGSSSIIEISPGIPYEATHKINGRTVAVVKDITSRPLCCQLQLGGLRSDDWHRFPDTDSGTINGHIVEALLSGDIALYQTLNGHVVTGHEYHCPTAAGAATSHNCKIVSDYLSDCLCLNDSAEEGEDPKAAENPINQQYYYLGDGLTKEQAKEFLGIYMFRKTNVNVIDDTV